MNLYNTHARGLRAMQARLDADCPVVSWDNEDWKIIPGSALRKAELGAGGFTMNADFRFNVLVETFARRPELATAKAVKDALLAKPIGYLDDEYQVETVTILAGGLQVAVECKSLHQNA